MLLLLSSLTVIPGRHVIKTMGAIFVTGRPGNVQSVLIQSARERGANAVINLHLEPCSQHASAHHHDDTTVLGVGEAVLLNDPGAETTPSFSTTLCCACQKRF